MPKHCHEEGIVSVYFVKKDCGEKWFALTAISVTEDQICSIYSCHSTTAIKRDNRHITGTNYLIPIRTIWKRTEVVTVLNTFLVFIQTPVNGSKRRRLRSYQAQWKSNLPANSSSLTNCYVCIAYAHQPTT